MGKKLKAEAVVMVMPFAAQVAIFKDLDVLIQYHRKRLGIEVETNPAVYGSAHENIDDKGVRWWAMCLPDTATLPTIVHECSHIVDFLMEAHGVPINGENTEIRAYMLGELFADVCHALGREIGV